MCGGGPPPVGTSASIANILPSHSAPVTRKVYLSPGPQYWAPRPTGRWSMATASCRAWPPTCPVVLPIAPPPSDARSGDPTSGGAPSGGAGRLRLADETGLDQDQRDGRKPPPELVEPGCALRGDDDVGAQLLHAVGGLLADLDPPDQIRRRHRGDEVPQARTRGVRAVKDDHPDACHGSTVGGNPPEIQA